MFSQNINPDLINIGPFSVRFYGIVYALGFILVTYILQQAAQKNKIKNLTKDKATDLVIYAMVFGLIGARIFHVADSFNILYRNNLLGIFEIWNGGLAFHGGVVGGVIAIYLYCKKHKIDLLKILDTMVIPFPFIIGFGRIANYINSEHLGIIAPHLSWCVNFLRIDDFCRHPVQIYESITMFALFAILMFANKSILSKVKGNLTWVFIAGYGIFRFTTDFFREHHNIRLFGNLSITQYFSLFMFVLGIYFLYKNNRVKKKK